MPCQSPHPAPGSARSELGAQQVPKVDAPGHRWATPDLLPEGAALTVLSGAPKTGKSLFTLQVAVEVAKGLKPSAPERPEEDAEN